MAENKTAGAKPATKSETYLAIAQKTGLSRKQIASVFDELAALVRHNLGKKGPGVFTVPGLLKLVRVNKPARKAQKGVPNPFRPGEMMDVKAKPAYSVVKARPLKSLKDMVK